MSSKEQIEFRRFYDNENQTGLERIKNLYVDYFKGVSRYEIDFVLNSFVFTFVGGGIWRSFFGSNEIIKEFHRKHNASVFMGKSDLKKQLLWFTIERLAIRGMSFGMKCGTLSGLCSLMAINTFVYRKDLRILDLTVGTGAAFALTRYNRGLRAISSSFMLGVLSGFSGAIILKGGLWVTNTTVKEWLDEMNQKSTPELFIPVKKDSITET